MEITVHRIVPAVREIRATMWMVPVTATYAGLVPRVKWVCGYTYSSVLHCCVCVCVHVCVLVCVCVCVLVHVCMCLCLCTTKFMSLTDLGSYCVDEFLEIPNKVYN